MGERSAGCQTLGENGYIGSFFFGFENCKVDSKMNIEPHNAVKYFTMKVPKLAQIRHSEGAGHYSEWDEWTSVSRLGFRNNLVWFWSRSSFLASSKETLAGKAHARRVHQTVPECKSFFP